jgi:glycosyltransferase involved in cell wall biosynthesis
MQNSGTMPLRVLFLDHTATMSGGEIALLELVRHLDPRYCKPIVTLGADGKLREKLDEAGVETHVLALASEVVQTRKDSLGGSSVLRLKTVYSMLRYIQRLARFFREQKIDLVHANSLKADILGGLAARRAHIPVIWHVRDRIEADYLPMPAVRLFRRLCRVVPSYVIANSEATLQTLRLNRRDRQSVVYSGVDLAAYPLSSLAPQTNREVQRIGLIGRISPWKGQHIFLQAAAEVRCRFPKARFQLIGAALFSERDYEMQLHTLVRSLQLEDCVEFLGFREDVPALLADLDMLVHASTSGEPFGQVIVQGMAAERPVVATASGGVLEIVEEGVTGLLVPPGDVTALAQAICTLLQQPERAHEMGLRGRLRVQERFTIQVAARKAESVYAEVMQRAGKSH